MTLEEMRELLAAISSFDGRAVDAFTIREWHETAVANIPADLARAAVRYWYSVNAGYIRPWHVVETAAALSGVARADSVTARRLEGLAPHFGGEGLAEPMQLERKAEQ